MRLHVLHVAWLAASLGACATAVVDPGSTPSGSHDAGHDAASFAKDSGAPGQDAASFGGDAGAPAVDSGSPTVPDSGSTQTSNCTPYTGALATFDFTNEPGNQASTAATSVATGVSAGALSRSTSLTATSGTSSINASNWTTSQSLDPTRYYTFTITPDQGCAVDLTSLSITTAASKTGPASGSIATSDDKFGKTVPFTIGSAATPSLTVSGSTGAIEVRVYGFGASSTAGTLRIATTLTVTGSVQ
jgi:hypothetical protein